MRVGDFDCTKEVLSYEGEEGYISRMDNMNAADNFDELLAKYKFEDASKLEELYPGIVCGEVKAICDLENGFLAADGVLSMLRDKGMNFETIKTDDGKTILDTSHTITIFEDYSNVLKGGFIGTFYFVHAGNRG